MMPVLDGRGTPQPEPMKPVEIRPRSEGTAAALLLAVLLLSAVLVIVGNLIADILYVVVDPRIRIGAGS